MSDSFLQERFEIEDHIHQVKELLMNRTWADRNLIVAIVTDELRATLTDDPFVKSVDMVVQDVQPQSLDAWREAVQTPGRHLKPVA